MPDPTDTATTQALLERLNERLPRMMALKARVDGGARVDDTDIAFLRDMLEDAQLGQSYIARHPELHDLGGRLVQLYQEIVGKATENETKGA